VKAWEEALFPGWGGRQRRRFRIVSPARRIQDAPRRFGISGVRWNDLGAPKRVLASLEMAGVRPHWVETASSQFA
jgi:hypothetical protein